MSPVMREGQPTIRLVESGRNRDDEPTYTGTEADSVVWESTMDAVEHARAWAGRAKPGVRRLAWATKQTSLEALKRVGEREGWLCVHLFRPGTGCVQGKGAPAIGNGSKLHIKKGR